MKYTIVLDPRELKSLCTACLHLKLDFQREARDPATSEERREICKKSAETWDRLRVNLHEQRDAQAAAQEAQTPADLLRQAGALELPQRVALYVPGTQGTATATATDNAAQVERVARAFSRWFGGATAQQSAGYWLSDTAGLVREAVTIVYAACTADQLRDRLPDVLTLAQQIKQDMAQEAVSVELNGTLYII